MSRPAVWIAMLLLLAPVGRLYGQSKTGIATPTALSTLNTTASTATSTSASGTGSTLFKSGGNSYTDMFKSTSSNATKSTSPTAGNQTRSNQGDGNVNPLLGEEFHIQRNHAPGSFVGADSTDKVGFVGSEQSTEEGTAKSAIDSLRFMSGNTVNAPLPVRRNTEIYDPRVELGFTMPARPRTELEAIVVQRMTTCLGLQRLGRLAVSVEETTATLRGEVASEQDRDLAEQLILFEPGVYAVQNLLTVKPAAPQKTAAPQASPSGAR
jgi:hypothetical protein